MIWIIEDWTGRDVFKLNFDSFDSAEDYLCEFLNSAYETDLQDSMSFIGFTVG